ncbi:MAG: hypothetical protein LBN25_02715, partial [Christensenellaceae bacterium]|nr:hypothetical protein [Christensenellaceae bacterium]
MPAPSNAERPDNDIVTNTSFAPGAGLAGLDPNLQMAEGVNALRALRIVLNPITYNEAGDAVSAMSGIAIDISSGMLSALLGTLLGIDEIPISIGDSTIALYSSLYRSREDGITHIRTDYYGLKALLQTSIEIFAFSLTADKVKVSIDTHILVNKTDGEGGFITDGDGNPVKEFAGYRNNQMPAIYLPDNGVFTAGGENVGFPDTVFISATLTVNLSADMLTGVDGNGNPFSANRFIPLTGTLKALLGDSIDVSAFIMFLGVIDGQVDITIEANIDLVRVLNSQIKLTVSSGGNNIITIVYDKGEVFADIEAFKIGRLYSADVRTQLANVFVQFGLVSADLQAANKSENFLQNAEASAVRNYLGIAVGNNSLLVALQKELLFSVLKGVLGVDLDAYIGEVFQTIDVRAEVGLHPLTVALGLRTDYATSEGMAYTDLNGNGRIDASEWYTAVPAGDPIIDENGDFAGGFAIGLKLRNINIVLNRSLDYGDWDADSGEYIRWNGTDGSWNNVDEFRYLDIFVEGKILININSEGKLVIGEEGSKNSEEGTDLSYILDALFEELLGDAESTTFDFTVFDQLGMLLQTLAENSTTEDNTFGGEVYFSVEAHVNPFDILLLDFSDVWARVAVSTAANHYAYLNRMEHVGEYYSESNSSYITKEVYEGLSANDKALYSLVTDISAQGILGDILEVSIVPELMTSTDLPEIIDNNLGWIQARLEEKVGEEIELARQLLAEGRSDAQINTVLTPRIFEKFKYDANSGELEWEKPHYDQSGAANFSAFILLYLKLSNATEEIYVESAVRLMHESEGLLGEFFTGYYLMTAYINAETLGLGKIKITNLLMRFGSIGVVYDGAAQNAEANTNVYHQTDLERSIAAAQAKVLLTIAGSGKDFANEVGNEELKANIGKQTALIGANVAKEGLYGILSLLIDPEILKPFLDRLQPHIYAGIVEDSDLVINPQTHEITGGDGTALLSLEVKLNQPVLGDVDFNNRDNLLKLNVKVFEPDLGIMERNINYFEPGFQYNEANASRGLTRENDALYRFVALSSDDSYKLIPLLSWKPMVTIAGYISFASLDSAEDYVQDRLEFTPLVKLFLSELDAQLGLDFIADRLHGGIVYDISASVNVEQLINGGLNLDNILHAIEAEITLILCSDLDDHLWGNPHTGEKRIRLFLYGGVLFVDLSELGAGKIQVNLADKLSGTSSEAEELPIAEYAEAAYLTQRTGLIPMGAEGEVMREYVRLILGNQSGFTAAVGSTVFTLILNALDVGVSNEDGSHIALGNVLIRELFRNDFNLNLLLGNPAALFGIQLLVGGDEETAHNLEIEVMLKEVKLDLNPTSAIFGGPDDAKIQNYQAIWEGDSGELIADLVDTPYLEASILLGIDATEMTETSGAVSENNDNNNGEYFNAKNLLANLIPEDLIGAPLEIILETMMAITKEFSVDVAINLNLQNLIKGINRLSEEGIIVPDETGKDFLNTSALTEMLKGTDLSVEFRNRTDGKNDLIIGVYYMYNSVTGSGDLYINAIAINAGTFKISSPMGFALTVYDAIMTIAAKFTEPRYPQNAENNFGGIYSTPEVPANVLASYINMYLSTDGFTASLSTVAIYAALRTVAGMGIIAGDVEETIESYVDSIAQVDAAITLMRGGVNSELLSVDLAISPTYTDANGVVHGRLYKLVQEEGKTDTNGNPLYTRVVDDEAIKRYVAIHLAFGNIELRVDKEQAVSDRMSNFIPIIEERMFGGVPEAEYIDINSEEMSKDPVIGFGTKISFRAYTGNYNDGIVNEKESRYDVNVAPIDKLLEYLSGVLVGAMGNSPVGSHSAGAPYRDLLYNAFGPMIITVQNETSLEIVVETKINFHLKALESIEVQLDIRLKGITDGAEVRGTRLGLIVLYNNTLYIDLSYIHGPKVSVVNVVTGIIDLINVPVERDPEDVVNGVQDAEYKDFDKDYVDIADPALPDALKADLRIQQQGLWAFITKPTFQLIFKLFLPYEILYVYEDVTTYENLLVPDASEIAPGRPGYIATYKEVPVVHRELVKDEYGRQVVDYSFTIAENFTAGLFVEDYDGRSAQLGLRLLFNGGEFVDFGREGSAQEGLIINYHSETACETGVELAIKGWDIRFGSGFTQSLNDDGEDLDGDGKLDTIYTPLSTDYTQLFEVNKVTLEAQFEVGAFFGDPEDPSAEGSQIPLHTLLRQLGGYIYFNQTGREAPYGLEDGEFAELGKVSDAAELNGLMDSLPQWIFTEDLGDTFVLTVDAVVGIKIDIDDFGGIFEDILTEPQLKVSIFLKARFEQIKAEIAQRRSEGEYITAAYEKEIVDGVSMLSATYYGGAV